MARKPGSWHKLNNLTNNVTVASRKKGWLAAICAVLYLGALIPSAYFGVSFLANILNYGGIETDGPLPDVNDGDYFEVNFAKTKLRDNTTTTPVFETYEIPPDPNTGQVAQTRARARSLRLEYAYNLIFEKAPSLYITNNIFFKNKYKDPKQIQILDIYTDSRGTQQLSLADVQQNQFNLMKNLLFLKIKYEDVIQKNLVWMPTLFVGNEGFLSNFLSFKLGETRNKDDLKPTVWEKQTNVLGEQANNIMINGTNDSLALADQFYAAYKERFAAFYAENKGNDKEFIGDYNPYSNFAISSVNQNDQLFPGTAIDSTHYMLDINRVIQSAYKKGDSEQSFAKTDNQINGKYIPQLLIFLINILETSQNRGLVLPKELVPTEWQFWYQHLQPKRLNVNQPEQFYFMFLPQGETIQNVIANRLWEQIKDVLNGKYSLATAIRELQEDVLSNPNSSKYKWVYDWNILPFQSYGIIEKADYTVVKRTIQENGDLTISFNNNQVAKTNYVIIDQPSLHSITNLVNLGDHDAYLISDKQKRNILFTKYWSANLYGAQKPLNYIDIDVRNIPHDVTSFKAILQKQIVNRTWEFIQNISQMVGNNLNISDNVSQIDYANGIADDIITFIPLNNYHNSAATFNDWFYALQISSEERYSNLTVLDIKLELKAKENVPDHLQTITFRFNINYI
ncbi:hypothetical protein [Spiroplasma endosymbiont of Megaselia nigra]|uniref:hypothetical protein n=1 Tax=Spiroplasma endosymbiont of Megaselia nigra TaxID=2478537 RepID=UPI000F896B02|nr:hypothetical protein [Spiroplasma endosymbiont of Megaselia nigra]RUO86850.1 hypothetical protein D9R21_00605 [Spiroplasma endosymbiont of Megaselia nigra]